MERGSSTSRGEASLLEAGRLRDQVSGWGGMRGRVKNSNEVEETIDWNRANRGGGTFVDKFNVLHGDVLRVVTV